MADCEHVAEVDLEVAPSGDGCVECLRDGTGWVHLRMCRSCGHVGCCDDSVGKHASAHSTEPGHAIVSSFEPGEAWWWCYVDERLFFRPSAPAFAHPG